MVRKPKDLRLCAVCRERLGAVALLVTLLTPIPAWAVRPFVTDDARIVYKGQLETESFAGVVFNPRDKMGVEARALQGLSLTDRFEIIGGGFGFTYHDQQARPLDMLIQPKYLLYRSFGPVPSVSVAAASLFPLAGNRQLWNSYAMMHVSWFLFTPQESGDPYDNGLAIHLNLGTKSQYDAGAGGYASKLYWAAAFEVITFTRELRFLGEVFNGDPFSYTQEFPAFQTGFRWYKTPDMQIDLVFKGARDQNGRAALATGTEIGPMWNYTVQVGLRVLFNVFR